MCQVLVPGGLGSVLVLVEEQQESLSHNLEGAEVTSYKSHVYNLPDRCTYALSEILHIYFCFSLFFLFKSVVRKLKA